jgi:hypothetical protein
LIQVTRPCCGRISAKGKNMTSATTRVGALRTSRRASTGVLPAMQPQHSQPPS